MTRLIFAVAILAFPLNVFAQGVSESADGSPGPPKTFLGWLASGQYVGVVEHDRSSDVRLFIYTDSDYQSVLNHTKLEKIGVNAEHAARENFGLKRKLEGFASDRKLDQAAIGKVLVLPRQQAIYAKIVSVGDDFVMIEYNDASTANPAPQSIRGNLRIIPRSRIASIDLHVAPILFSLPTEASDGG